MNRLSWLGWYPPNGPHETKPALWYSARAAAKAAVVPVSRLTVREALGASGLEQVGQHGPPDPVAACRFGRMH
jgi:hypothetical protein